MHAVLLNLITTGEIRSVTYADRWFDFERTSRLFTGFDWASTSIIRFENGSAITFRSQP